MKRSSLIEQLRKWKPIAHEQYRTELLALFGSYAREEASSASDIDVLVDFLPEASLFDWVALSQAMEEEFNLKVDLVSKKDLKPTLSERIQKEQIVI